MYSVISDKNTGGIMKVTAEKKSLYVCLKSSVELKYVMGEMSRVDPGEFAAVGQALVLAKRRNIVLEDEGFVRIPLQRQCSQNAVGKRSEFPVRKWASDPANPQEYHEAQGQL